MTLETEITLFKRVATGNETTQNRNEVLSFFVYFEISLRPSKNENKLTKSIYLISQQQHTGLVSCFQQLAG